MTDRHPTVSVQWREVFETFATNLYRAAIQADFHRHGRPTRAYNEHARVLGIMSELMRMASSCYGIASLGAPTERTAGAWNHLIEDLQPPGPLLEALKQEPAIAELVTQVAEFALKIRASGEALAVIEEGAPRIPVESSPALPHPAMPSGPQPVARGQRSGPSGAARPSERT